MNHASSSPLKAIQGAAIIDLTDGRYGPPKFGRSRSSRRRFSRTSSLKPHGPRLSCVSIPIKPKYIPNQRPPPKVHSSLPNGAAQQNERSRKVVISRFLLVDGNISFAVGTQTDGIITRDPQEVPVSKILDHVSPAELERFENQDFFEEDERERLRPPKKHPGRPRRVDTVLPSFSVAPIGEEGSILIKKRSGRPKGSRNKVHRGRPKGLYKGGPYREKVDRLVSTEPPVLSEPSTAIRKPRGRPPLQKKFAVVIPSFNGPQPQELESTPSAESESDEISGHPKPQYSMITASGLGQSDTEDVISRDQSVELVSSSNKRRLDSSTAFVDLDNADEIVERSPHPTKRAKSLPETSPDPIADDSAALLRQFQARVYGPDQSTKGSTEPSPTLDDSTALLRQFRAHSHPSSLGSSSPDSLMEPIPRQLKSPQAQHIPSKPLPEEAIFPHMSSSSKNPTKASALSITVCDPPKREPAKAAPTKLTSPPKAFQRKVSLTPHFPPPSTSLGHHSSLSVPADSRPRPSNNRHAPSYPTNTDFPPSSRIMPSSPKKRKLSPVPRNTPSQSSQASSTSKIGFAGLPQAKHITDFFAPKAKTAKAAPVKAPQSPTLQLLDPEDSESEDQLARGSSPDSIGSEVVIVRQNRVTPIYQAAATEAMSQEPSNDNEQIYHDSWEDDSSKDEREDELDITTHHPHTAAPVYPGLSPAKVQDGAEALNQAFDLEDDGDPDSNSDSDSDSLNSEVMIVRSR